MVISGYGDIRFLYKKKDNYVKHDLIQHNSKMVLNVPSIVQATSDVLDGDSHIILADMLSLKAVYSYTIQQDLMAHMIFI